MKRFLLCACVAALLPALALAQTANPNAKVDPKNNKVGKPVVEKPKQKLMTRDELRSCFKSLDKNDTEARAIKAAQAANTQERAELVQAKELLTKQGEAINAMAPEIKTERDTLIKAQEDIKAQVAKLDKAAAEALIKDYQTRAAAVDAKIEAYNAAKLKYADEAKVFDAKIEAHNNDSRALQTRTEAHLDEVDNWKEDCSKKPYDEADEIAVKKELGLK
jgi:chromosome segregation ATPase